MGAWYGASLVLGLEVGLEVGMDLRFKVKGRHEPGTKDERQGSFAGLLLNEGKPLDANPHSR